MKLQSEMNCTKSAIECMNTSNLRYSGFEDKPEGTIKDLILTSDQLRILFEETKKRNLAFKINTFNHTILFYPEYPQGK